MLYGNDAYQTSGDLYCSLGEAASIKKTAANWTYDKERRNAPQPAPYDPPVKAFGWLIQGRDKAYLCRTSECYGCLPGSGQSHDFGEIMACTLTRGARFLSRRVFGSVL